MCLMNWQCPVLAYDYGICQYQYICILSCCIMILKIPLRLCMSYQYLEFTFLRDKDVFNDSQTVFFSTTNKPKASNVITNCYGFDLLVLFLFSFLKTTPCVAEWVISCTLFRIRMIAAYQADIFISKYCILIIFKSC